MTIAGVRVHLKPTGEQDLPFLLALWNDGRVMKWVGFSDGLGYTQERMADWLERSSANPCFHHYIVLNAAARPCGEVCYWVDVAHRRAGLDVKFTPESQGRGLATDALSALIDHVFCREPDVDEVWTEPSPENRASQALYARCGLSAKPRPSDLDPDWPSYWSLDRRTWRERGGDCVPEAVDAARE